MTEDTCKSCFKTAEIEPVKVKRDGQWVDSTVRRCANAECHAVREGTLADRLQHVRSVYDYKYFGDYELSPEQNDAVWEAKAIAERVPVMLEALKRVYFEWDGEPEDMIHVQAAIAKAEGRQ